MSKIGKKIPCRSCLTEAILVIGKKIVRFKMFDEVGIKQSFENLGNSRSESNKAIVGGVRAVTLLRYRLNKCMLPRRRISTGNKNEAKKTTVPQQIPSGIWGERRQGLKPCLSLKNEAPGELYEQR